MTNSTITDAAATVLPTPSAVTARGETRDRLITWHVASVLFAATSVVVGVIWDISWHMSIGRDTFWTPAHLAIYLGGIVGGTASGVVVLRTTFGGGAYERALSVRFWGFRGPLGAWVSIWGAFAMITSAPFDNWWHNAYGLDVEILSPPHVVLALGMVALAVGAMLVLLARQNRAEGKAAVRYAWMYSYAAGCVLSFLAIMITDYSWRILQHSSPFYKNASLVFPFFLVAAGNASKLRWGATAIAATYMAIRMLMLWVLPLFPAEPGLGPIYQEVTHMIPMEFPLLLLVPAMVMDLVRRAETGGSETGDGRRETGNWVLGVKQGLAFFAALLVTQWLFSEFLLSPAAKNWVFGTHYFPYSVPKTSSLYRDVFVRLDDGRSGLVIGLAVGAVFAVASASLGVLWARWFKKVQR